MDMKLTNGPCHYCDGEGTALDQKATRLAMVKVREEAGISQASMARKLKLDRSVVCRLEGGRRKWNRSWVHRWLAQIKRPVALV